jgi:hypothetical protein
MAKKYKRSVSQSAARQAVPAGAAAPAERSAAPTSMRRTTVEFNPDYSYVVKDLKRIGTLAGSFFVILIILSFILNR